MMWGETNEERRRRRQTWRKGYAWLPTLMFTGEWVWLEPYWERTVDFRPVRFRSYEVGVEAIKRPWERMERPPPPKPK